MHLGLPALLLAGCEAPCPAIEDIPVTDPDGAAPAETVAGVEAAIAQFAAWSDRGGVCVDEVRLVPEIAHDDGDEAPAGRYYGTRIEVDYTPSRAVDEVVYHELCHAVDADAGWLSRLRPDWFPSDRPHEDFAYACGEGPVPTSLLEAVETACGEDLGAERQRWIDNFVYGAADIPADPPAGTLAVALERRALTGLPEGAQVGNPVAGRGVLFLPIETQGNAEGTPVDLLVVDPGTAAVVASIPAGRFDWPDDYGVYAADGDPLLVRWGVATEAWRVDAEAGALVPVPFPTVGEHRWIPRGAVLGATAYVLGTFVGDATQAWWRVDLASGEREAFPLPADITYWSPAPDGALLAGPAGTAAGRVWLSYDPAAEAWSRWSSPAGWHGLDRVTLADGRVVASWTDYAAMTELHPTGLGVIDAGTGEWWLPDAPCGDDRVSMTLDVLDIDGEAWLFEYGSGWVEGDPFFGTPYALTRVVVP